MAAASAELIARTSAALTPAFVGDGAIGSGGGASIICTQAWGIVAASAGGIDGGYDDGWMVGELPPPSGVVDMTAPF